MFTKFNMNNNTNTENYRSKDEMNNQFFLRENPLPKKNAPLIGNNGVLSNNNGVNYNSNIGGKVQSGNQVPQKKYPFGGRVPFAYNKDDPDMENNENEGNDVEMNFRENAGDNFYKKMKSNIDKDPAVFEEPDEKKEKSISIH